MPLSNQDINKIAERTAEELDTIRWRRETHSDPDFTAREDERTITYQLKKKGVRQPFATLLAFIVRIGIYLIFIIFVFAVLYFTQGLGKIVEWLGK